MNDHIVLKPCPYCGNDLPGHEEDSMYYIYRSPGTMGGCDVYHVFCDDCSLQGPTGEMIVQAVERWNIVAQLKEEIDELWKFFADVTKLYPNLAIRHKSLEFAFKTKLHETN